jgi:hypothetical protein
MADADLRPFGDSGRDYAANAIPTAAPGGQVLNKQVTGFLREYDPELQLKVQRAFKQWGQQNGRYDTGEPWGDSGVPEG